MNQELTTSVCLKADQLDIERLVSGKNWRRVVKGVSLTVEQGKVLALIGEEGCGKSEVARAMAGRLPDKFLRVSSGSIHLEDESLVGMSRRKLRKLRQRKIAYFHRNMTLDLNPRSSIRKLFSEACEWKSRAERESDKSLIQALYEVGIAEPELVIERLAGDLRTETLIRVLICMALQAGVEFFVADEMTAGLDTIIQQQVVELLVDLKNRGKLSMLFVAHHPGMIKALADEIAVIYDGAVIERGEAGEVLSSPGNQYTRALLSCAPHLRDRHFRLGELSEKDRVAARMAAAEQTRIPLRGDT